jgi:plasmid stabilization system protein ParE
MDQVDVFWTKDGAQSPEDIVRYIARDSEFYASRFAARILSLVERLHSLPEMGRVVPEDNVPAIRELIFQNYRIVYKFDRVAVFVALVIHGNRRMPASL